MPVVNSDWVEIHYEDVGSGKPLVMLHGVWMSSRFFQDQVKRLSATHRIITIDFRGHGKSATCMAGHTVPTYAADVRAVIEKLGLKKPAMLGWSMGVFVTWEYVLQNGADSISSSIVVCESPSDFKWPDWPLGIADLPMLTHLMEGMQADQEALVDAFIPMMFAGEPSSQVSSWMKAEITRVPPAVANSILFDQTMRDYRESIPQVSVPTLLLFGKGDKLVDVGAGEYLQKHLPRAELVVLENSGHVPFIEQPDEFETAVVNFLATSCT